MAGGGGDVGQPQPLLVSGQDTKVVRVALGSASHQALLSLAAILAGYHIQPPLASFLSCVVGTVTIAYAS